MNITLEHRAEKPRHEASVASGNTTVEKVGGKGGGGEANGVTV